MLCVKTVLDVFFPSFFGDGVTIQMRSSYNIIFSSFKFQYPACFIYATFLLRFRGTDLHGYIDSKKESTYPEKQVNPLSAKNGRRAIQTKSTDAKQTLNWLEFTSTTNKKTVHVTE